MTLRTRSIGIIIGAITLILMMGALLLMPGVNQPLAALPFNPQGSLGSQTTTMGMVDAFAPGAPPLEADVSVAAYDDGSLIDERQQAQGGELRRVILKTASLRLVVEAADATLAAISAMAGEMGGWVVSSSTSLVTTGGGQEVARGSITVRVPAERLDEALQLIKSGTGIDRVESESVSGQDVTQQYVDLTSRLTNLEAAEVQLRTILDEARRTEDVLTVYTELVRVRGEIEVVRGQINYYDESAAYSSISVELIPKAIDEPIVIAGWSPGRTAEQALASLLNILRFIVDVVITFVITVLPLILLVVVPIWGIRRVRRVRRGHSSL